MPELPEVETVKRGLEGVLVGARIVRVEQRRGDLRFPFPDRFVERLEGRTVEGLGRRAKYLLAHIEGGEVLTMHLGMSGRFTIAAPVPDAVAAIDAVTPGHFHHDAGGDTKHDHVVFTMSNGASVTYNDARRFGYMMLIDERELIGHALFKDLGPEPLGNELNAAYLAQRATGKAVDLKAFLMDQRIIAGLGNIYVCEALHRAGLAPKRAASSLAKKPSGKPTDRAGKLVPAIRTVLEAAIAAGGSTLRDFAHADGKPGYFQHAFSVYGREGEPCRTPGCLGTIKRIVQSNRSTYYCPGCQR